jgi:transmembrane sensor
MIHREEFLQLFEKHLKGECTVEEQTKLQSYRDEIELSNNLWEADEVSQQEVYNRIWLRLEESRHLTILKKNKPFNWFHIAAVLSVMGACVTWFIQKPAPPKSTLLSTAITKPIPIQPGKNNAFLTLANGKHIALNDLHNGTVATQSGIQVTKTQDGTLVYRLNSNQSISSAASLSALNTITTPRGGQYQLVLADGTRVWLNSASAITFTTALAGSERRVKLFGEAYFEVAKQSGRPFIVETAHQEIKVLGTHFNVQAYTDEQLVKTSLLEGKVNITTAGKVATLKPGQEAINEYNGKLIIHQAAVGESIAWKNGFFKFNNAGIKDVMQQLARWYNIKVSYAGDLPVRQFNGTISRQVSIQEVLDMLRYTGVQFKIAGDHVIVCQQ